MDNIKAVYGLAPPAEELQHGAAVGHNKVTKISSRFDMRGGMWFDVFKGDFLVLSFNERHIAEVHYFDKDGK